MKGEKGKGEKEDKRVEGGNREDVVEGACELCKVDEREAARGTETGDVAAHDTALWTHVSVVHKLFVAVVEFVATKSENTQPVTMRGDAETNQAQKEGNWEEK